MEQSQVKKAAEMLLRRWFELANLRDQHGVPVDLMFYALRERNALPQVIEGRAWRDVTEEEFAKGVSDCVAVLQRRAPRGTDLTAEQVDRIRALMTARAN